MIFNQVTVATSNRIGEFLQSYIRVGFERMFLTKIRKGLRVVYHPASKLST